MGNTVVSLRHRRYFEGDQEEWEVLIHHRNRPQRRNWADPGPYGGDNKEHVKGRRKIKVKRYPVPE